jgi:arylsulfatase
VFGQEITGTPGSPSATTAISGKQLPAPDPEFGGVSKNYAQTSKGSRVEQRETRGL